MITRIYLRDQNDVVFDVIDHGEYFGDTINRYLQGKASIFTLKIIKRDKDYQRIKAGIRISFMLDDGEEFWMNCVKVEQDEKFLTMTCLSLGLELNNEQIGPYKSPKAMTIAEYIGVIDFEKVLTIRANEVSDKKISYEWTGTESKLARLFSLAKVFSAEIEFSTKLNSNGTLKSIIVDIYKEHDDKNQGIGNDRRTSTFYFGEEIKTIRKTEDIYDLYTCILPTGENGLTISNVEKEVFDDDGNLLYATYRTAKPDFPDVRKIYAVQAREQFPSTTSGNDRWIAYSPEQTQYKDENALYGYALSELKKNCVPKVTWEIEGYIDAKIGDTVRIADESYTPTLYLEARIVEQEISITDKTKNKSTFSNVKELESQISSDLLAQMEALIKANKTWNTTLSTDNGTFFKNGSDETTITARVFDGALDITDTATFNWYKDGVFAGVSKSFKVLASEIDTKSVYKVEVYDQYGNVRSQNELTITKVKDGRGVMSSVVEYQVSSSGTVPPTGNWSSTPPTATSGQYIWTRTTFIYSDNQKTFTYTVGRIGGNGVGVSNVDVEYKAGESGTTPPIGTWTTTIPKVGENQYLWTRTKTTYTDSSVTTAYSVGKMGADGADAQLLYLSASANTMKFDSDGFVVPNQSIAITAKLQNVSGNATFVAVPYIGNAAQDPFTLSGAGNERYLFSSQWTSTQWTTIAITATLGSLTDTISVVKVKDGEQGPQGVTGATGPKGDKGDKGDTGATGATGATGNGVSSTNVSYGISNSGTTPPTSWGSSVPTVSSGQFLWTRTIIYYTNGTNSTSYSIGKMGEQGPTGPKGDKGETGATGATGAAGNGISSTVITYGVSSSGTTAPTSWSTSVPSVSAGQFLWTRTIITYTNGTTSTAYSVGKMGEQGATGPKGDKGDKGSIYKALTTNYKYYQGDIDKYSTNGYTGVWYVNEDTSDLSNGDMVTLSIKNRSKNVFSLIVAKVNSVGKNSEGKNYANTTSNGLLETGAKGDTGNGVSSTVINYGVSTSGTSQPSSWGTSIPSVPGGQYLWTRTVMNYTNGSSTTFFSVAKMGETGARGSMGIAYLQPTAPTGSIENGSTWFKTVSSTDRRITSVYHYLSGTWVQNQFTQDAINVKSLSALSATLGNVTAGTITGSEFTNDFNRSYTSTLNRTGTTKLSDGKLRIDYKDVNKSTGAISANGSYIEYSESGIDFTENDGTSTGKRLELNSNRIALGSSGGAFYADPTKVQLSGNGYFQVQPKYFLSSPGNDNYQKMSWTDDGFEIRPVDVNGNPRSWSTGIEIAGNNSYVDFKVPYNSNVDYDTRIILNQDKSFLIENTASGKPITLKTYDNLRVFTDNALIVRNRANSSWRPVLASGFSQQSDEKWKYNIKDMPSRLEQFKNLDFKAYRLWAENGKYQEGVIANDNIGLPFISKGYDGYTVDSYAYITFIGKATQEYIVQTDNTINELKNENAELKTKVDNLTTELETIKQQLATLLNK